MSSVIQHSECSNVIKIHNGISLISTRDCHIHVYVFSTSVCFLFIGSLALEEILATWLLLMGFTKGGYLPMQPVCDCQVSKSLGEDKSHAHLAGQHLAILSSALFPYSPATNVHTLLSA